MLFLLLTSAQATEKPIQQAHISIGDIKGNTYQITGTEQGFDIKGVEGKIIFLEFFGHRCPPCLASIPHLIKLQEKYKKKLAIIAIEVQDYPTEKLREFVKEKGMNYTVIPYEKAENFVKYISLRADWRGSIPFLVALDTKGVVQFIHAGMLPESSLEELIKQLSDTKPAKEESKKIPSETNSTKE